MIRPATANDDDAGPGRGRRRRGSCRARRRPGVVTAMSASAAAARGVGPEPLGGRRRRRRAACGQNSKVVRPIIAASAFMAAVLCHPYKPLDTQWRAGFSCSAPQSKVDCPLGAVRPVLSGRNARMTRVCLAVLVALAGLAGTPPLPRTSAAVSAAPSATPPAACCRASPSPSRNTDTGVAQTVVTDGKGAVPGALPEPRHLHRRPRSSPASRSRPRRQRGPRRRRRCASTSCSQTGGVEETVQVTADAPLLNTTHRHQRHDGRRQADRASCRSATARPTC